MNIIKILDNALKNNGFTEKRTYVVNSYYKLYRADLGEEKYIFALCNSTARFLLPDIISIKEEAKKIDCYKVIIINQMRTPYSEKLQSKIAEYGMELWELNKLITMSKSNKIYNASDISNNKSEFCTDSYNPIQNNPENKSILGKKMKKSILILLSVILFFVIIYIGKYGTEYIITVNKIKNSETYYRNDFVIDYDEKSYVVKIPKGLGDLNLKGNVIYAFKSLKSVDEIKKEFSNLYGDANVVVENNIYYYKSIDDNYTISVKYGEGAFTDIYILEIHE